MIGTNPTWYVFGRALLRKLSSCLPPSAARAILSMPYQGLLLGYILLVLGEIHCGAADRPVAKPDSTPPTSLLMDGKVTAIVDGDTLHLATGNANYSVDLAGIDAPEKGQPSGDMAAQVLYLKLLQKQVQVLVLATPSANPIVTSVVPKPTTAPTTAGAALRQRVCGIIYCGGCVNSMLVHEGMAWHDARTCPSTTLAQAQEAARKGRRGLWQSDHEPIPPWLWRSQRRAAVVSTGIPKPQGQEVRDLSRFFDAKTPAAAIEAATQMPPATASSPPVTASPAPPIGAKPALPGNYWLTDSSGIRHNSKCRYFQKSKGRPCGAQDGRPCQKCGG